MREPNGVLLIGEADDELTAEELQRLRAACDIGFYEASNAMYPVRYKLLAAAEENAKLRAEAKRQWEVNERLRAAIAPLLLWGRKLDDPEAIKNAEIMPRSHWHPELLAAIDALKGII